MDDRTRKIAAGYDVLAEAYAAELFDELRHKPLDRALLAAFAEQVEPGGTVLELGCGPGQVAHHLQSLGLRVIGIDASPGMIAVARQRSPDLEFRTGDLLALDEPDGARAGVVAFYAIVHLQADELLAAFREMVRVLRPGGLALVSFHLGDERVRPGELWGQKMDLEWVFMPRACVEDAMRRAGLVVEMQLEREPYPDVEHPSRRAYLLARRS